MSRRDRRREAALASVQEQPAPVVTDESVEPEPTEAEPGATPGFVVCRVDGCAVNANGKRYEIGDVAEFLSTDVASLPDHLIPV